MRPAAANQREEDPKSLPRPVLEEAYSVGLGVHIYLEPNCLLAIEGEAPAICHSIHHQQAHVFMVGLLERLLVEGELRSCIRHDDADADLTFMDSTGLHLLVTSARELEDRGCIILHGLDGNRVVRRVLELSQVDSLGNIHLIECDEI